MKKHFAAIAILVMAFSAGCTVGDTSDDSLGSQQALGQNCADPCGPNEECDDGVCKPHGGDDADDAGVDDEASVGSGSSCNSDADCPSGEECDDGACKAHGGDQAGSDDAGDPGGDDASDGSDDGTADDVGSGASCTTDADCSAGEECDDGACKSHGGNEQEDD